MANRPKLKHRKHNVAISNRIIDTLLIACLSLFASNVLAQDAKFAEGAQYEILSEAQPTQSGDKIEVVEMFWYKCPHCYALEPYLEEWKENKTDNTEYVSIPTVFSKNWEFDARVYYTLQALGLEEELHSKMFDAVHKERKTIKTKKQFADWAVENGADRKKLLAMFDSFTVQSKVKFSKVMSRKYEIPGVPAIIVDGKYRTSVSLAGSQEKLIEVIDYLVELAGRTRG